MDPQVLSPSGESSAPLDSVGSSSGAGMAVSVAEEPLTADRLHAVAAAAAGVIGARSREALRRVLEDACRKVIPFDAFFVQRYDAETHTFHGFGGLDTGVLSPPEVVPAAGTPAERVVRERRSLLTLSADDPAARGAQLTGTGRRSESVIRSPILSGDDVLGVLAIHSYTPGRYTPADVEVTEVMAALTATALLNVQLAEERQAAEAALQEREHQLREAQRLAHLGSWSWTVGSDRVAWSAEMFRIYSLPRQGTDVAFSDFISAIHPEDRAALLEAVENARLSGTPFRMLHRIVRPDGQIRVLECRGDVRLGEAGTPVQLYGTGQDVTEREEAEAALQRAHDELEERVAVRTAELAHRTDELARAEQRFRAIVEASPTPLLLSRLEDGVVLYANDRLEALIGVAPGSLLGRHTPDFYYDPSDRPGVLQTIREQGYARDLELRIKRADGTPRWVSLSVQRMDFDGVPALASSLLDISERKAAEEALRRRTHELEAIFRALPDLYFRMEGDGTIRDYRAGRSFGLYVPPDAFLGQRVQDVLPPPVSAQVDEAIGEVARTGEMAHFEYMLPLDGERRDFEARLLPLPDGQVVAVVRDVTARKQAEEALRASEASYRGLFDSLTELVYIQDLEGRFLNVNEAVLQAYGYTREELIGQTPDFLGAPGTVDPAAFAATFARTLAGEPQLFEWWGLRKDGSVFPKEVVIKRTTYFGQDVVIAVARDITERKRAEATLRLQKTLLEAQGEASIDGFLVVSEDGRILSYNQRLREMWDFPASVLASGTREEVVRAIYDKVVDPAAYFERANFLYAHPEDHARDEVLLRDGRVFDRYSAPVVSHEGDYYGRIWFFRDITEQKRHAAELEQARQEAERARVEASHYASSLERELEFGRQIQQGLLPASLPQPPNWEIAVRFSPVWQVAGDFYDAFELPSGRIGLIIADVSGKGVGAALFMALFQSLLRASAERASTGVAGGAPSDRAILLDAITSTNDYITRVHRHAHMFASVFFGVLDPASGVLHYVNAGHEPPVVLGVDGSRRLAATGPALGLLAGAPFEAERTRLAPGEVLLAYTDGVTEARDPERGFFSEERLMALLAEPAATAVALLDRIEEAVHRFAGSAPPSDDLTLLAVRYEAAG